MTRKALITAIGVILLLTSFTSSQKKEILDELMKISSTFEKKNNIKVRLTYRVYKGYNATKYDSQIDAVFQKRDSLSIYRVKQMTTYSNSVYSITINKEGKMVIISEANPGYSALLKMKDFEKLLQK